MGCVLRRADFALFESLAIGDPRVREAIEGARAFDCLAYAQEPLLSRKSVTGGLAKTPS
jgi:hypothetical protein